MKFRKYKLLVLCSLIVAPLLACEAVVGKDGPSGQNDGGDGGEEDGGYNKWVHLVVEGDVVFGEQAVGTRTVRFGRVLNVGNVNVELTHVYFLQSTTEYEVSLGAALPFLLEPGAGVEFEFSYTPQDLGTDWVTLAFYVADDTYPGIEVVLTGTGVPAVPNTPPVAVVSSATVQSEPLRLVPFSGSGSYDPDGGAVTGFLWTLEIKPVGSKISLLYSPYTENAELFVDVVGLYVVSLVVTDDSGGVSEAQEMRVEVAPSSQFYVELVWDTAGTDLDLHLTAPGGTRWGYEDCYFGNNGVELDWGVSGDTTDNPRLDRDDTVGYGPEVAQIASPAAGTYRVAVHFYAAPQPYTLVTVRIYAEGVLTEYSRTLVEQYEMWEVADIEWPAGTVTAVDNIFVEAPPGS